MIDLSPFISPGGGVWWSQGCAEPTALIHSLLDQVSELGPIRAFCGTSWNRRLTTQLPDEISLSSYGALGDLRKLSRDGRLAIVPCNYSSLPRLFESGLLPHDVGLIQVSSPDSQGRCSLGIGVDYVADALLHTPIIVAEINSQMPETNGTPRIPMERFAAFIETDRPLLDAPQRQADDVDRAIAQNVAGLVNNGDTIQIGIGPLPAAVLGALEGHEELGIHSGMISDDILNLVDRGVITGARKRIDTGIIVTGTALGTERLYKRIPDLALEFRATSYTHSLATLGQLHNLVSINSAIEVDLSGQVGSEMRRSSYVGAVGGQVDFSHAAATSGARSIIALRSTSNGESTIKSYLEGHCVSTLRTDVDFVVTEHGVAHLTGATPAARARRLFAIAAPEHRESLEQSVICIGRSDPGELHGAYDRQEKRQ